MDIDLKLAQWQKQATQALQSLSSEDLYNLWLVAGAVLFAVLAWVSYRIMRKALGHQQFRGTWHNENEIEVLVKMIDEDCQRGNRVMRHDEMSLLRKWRFGSNKAIGHGKGYF